MYDCKTHQYLNFKNIRLKSKSSQCYTLGEYVIFDSEFSEFKLDFEGVAENCQKYEFLNLNLINKPAIILHKGYIQKLSIRADLEQDLEFEPTNFLDLMITYSYKHISSGLLNYIDSHPLLYKLHTRVKFEICKDFNWT